jgi:hypothetical protein
MQMIHRTIYGLLIVLIVIGNPIRANEHEGVFAKTKSRFFDSKTVNKVRETYHTWQQKRKEKKLQLKSDIPQGLAQKEPEEEKKDDKKAELKDILQNQLSQVVQDQSDPILKNENSAIPFTKKRQSKMIFIAKAGIIGAIVLVVIYLGVRDQINLLKG